VLHLNEKEKQMATCVTSKGSSPIGGQGASAKCSRIYFIPPNCTTGIKLDGTAPSGTAKWFVEQVIRIEVRAMVSSRSYGHDKSFCCTDVTPGINSFNGVITSRVQCCDVALSMPAGAVAWLQVFPLGDSGAVIEGYAMITEAPMIMNIESGDPIEANYTFTSKGLWNTDFAFINTVTDCCSCCNESSMFAESPIRGMRGIGGSDEMLGGSVHDEASRLITHNPQTVYTWTGSDWERSFDESGGEFMPGPIPQEPGKYPGQPKYVPCVLAV
jgi:hypothetical protein